MPTPNEQRRHFERLIAPLAYTHYQYLSEESLTLSQCYTLELTAHGSRLEVARSVPLDLYEALLEAHKQAFG